MAQNVICSGWLDKKGGAGHGRKNTRRRFFLLRSLFLAYYEKPPIEGKDVDGLKGMLYLVGCSIKDVTEDSLTLCTRVGKEYIFSADKPSELQAWNSALQYALEKAQRLKETNPLEGSLQKRGGKGHGVKNWKKRTFILRGNYLCYYDGMPDDENDVDKLKGFIDITEISQLTQIEDAADGCDKPNYIKIVVNNSREYFLAASDVEEKSKWFRAIRKQMKRIAAEFQLLSRDLKDLPENVVYVGNLQKRSKLGQTEKAWFALTTRNLRFYKAARQNVEQDYGEGLLGTIPLLGASITPLQDPTMLQIMDTRGYDYTVVTDGIETTKTWLEHIQAVVQKLIEQMMKKEIPIQIYCNPTNESKLALGYTLVSMENDGCHINHLFTKTSIKIPYHLIAKIYVEEGPAVVLVHNQDGKEKTIYMKCPNAPAIVDCIQNVIQVLYKMQQNLESKKPKKSPRENSSDKSPRKSPRESSSEKPKKTKKSPRTSPSESEKPASATPRLSDDGLTLVRPKADSITGVINVSTSSRRRSTLEVPD